MDDKECPTCGQAMEFSEELFSNYNGLRTMSGHHTGDVYLCKPCDALWIDDFLSKVVRPFQYE